MPRTRDPSRRALPFAHWPANDRDAWLAAIADGDILDGRGPATHWADRTKLTNRQHYGRWLGFLTWRGFLDTQAVPVDRATRDAVRAYHDHLRRIVAPRTVLSMLVGLKVCLQAFEPDRSWRWLQDACNRIQQTAEPAREKQLRIRDSGEIFLAAMAELDRLADQEVTLDTAIGYRDALMLALLAVRPLRVRNMQSIRLGRHLLQSSDGWLLVFPASETKNREPLEYTWPEALREALDLYLSRYRPMFPDGEVSDRLWLNKDGARLGRCFVYSRIVPLTRRLLAVAINPHLLRDCAASSLVRVSGDAARSAKALLGHRHFSTTERYYIAADNLEASRRINDILDAVKRSSKEIAR